MGSTGDNAGRRQVDVFYYSQPSKGVRSPWWSLQRPVSGVTSKRQGLGDSRLLRRCRGNSQVPRQGSLLWRHQWDQGRSLGNTGQSFDPIRGKSSREGLLWGRSGGKWSAVILYFRSKTCEPKEGRQAAAPSLFNTQLTLDASGLKHRVETKKDPW